LLIPTGWVPVPSSFLVVGWPDRPFPPEFHAHLAGAEAMQGGDRIMVLESLIAVS